MRPPGWQWGVFCETCHKGDAVGKRAGQAAAKQGAACARSGCDAPAKRELGGCCDEVCADAHYAGALRRYQVVFKPGAVRQGYAVGDQCGNCLRGPKRPGSDAGEGRQTKQPR